MFIFIIPLCIIPAFPAFFLSYKLVKTKFLGTVFNSGAALTFAVSGNFPLTIFKIRNFCPRPLYACISHYLHTSVDRGP